MECPICGRFYIDLETGYDIDEVCLFHTEEEVEEFLHGTDDGMNPDGWREPDEEDDEEGFSETEVG